MHALSIRGLTKTYGGKVHALKGIDLEVAPGEFFALLGPNGAGKTTTIGVITSLVNKTAGTVEVFGHDVDRARAEVKACIGLVPQELNFNQFERVHDIVVNQAGFYGVPRKLALERAEKYLTQLQLWEKRDAASRTLSGGMKRRLMIARALMHEPRLLILDEPTAGVDIEIRRSMWQFLAEINRAGTTIILTTHYLEEAEQLCPRLAIIDGGQIVRHGRTRELLEDMHVETFVLNLARPCALAPTVAGFEVRRIDELTLEVDVLRERNLNDVFARLSESGVEVLSMRNKANRLEEVFLRLIGANAKPTAASAPKAGRP
jgi:ABC-2 type transport system ATP-binding protein